MTIAIIGDHDQLRPSHIAAAECLQRAGSYLSATITAEWLPVRETFPALAHEAAFKMLWWSMQTT